MKQISCKNIVWLFMASFVMVQTIQSQCVNFGTKMLTGTSNPKYSWYWDNELNGLVIKKKLPGGGTTAMTEVEARTTIRSLISSAFSSWNAATNSTVSGYEYDVNNPVYPIVVVQIADMNEASNEEGFAVAYGNYAYQSWNYRNVYINTKPGSYNWTIDPTMLPNYLGNTYANIRTLILHEIGHVFTSQGHGDNTTVMGANGNCFHNAAINSLQGCDVSNCMRLYDPKHTIILKNSFGDGGVMDIKGFRDGQYSHIVVPSTGYDPQWRESSFPASVVAVDGQMIQEGARYYKRRFNIWLRNGVPYSPPNSAISMNIDDATYTAIYVKEFNINFINNRGTFGNGGSLIVSQTPCNSPTSTFYVKQGTVIQAEAVNETINRVQFYFQYWSNSNNQTTYSNRVNDFTPSDHTTYTANFTSKVLPPENVFAGGMPDNNVLITWSEHPNANVGQYQIWRGVKHGKTGHLDQPVQIGTVNRGTTSFVDFDYIVTGGYVDCLLHYDVRAVYQSGGTVLYSEPSYIASTFGTMSFWKDQKKADAALEIQSISISLHPNPFNPATVLNYQLPLGRQYVVIVKVYDMAGKEIETLADGVKNGGYHSAAFNGASLASGMYFARFTAIPQDGSKPFIQTQKMILAK